MSWKNDFLTEFAKGHAKHDADDSGFGADKTSWNDGFPSDFPRKDRLHLNEKHLSHLITPDPTREKMENFEIIELKYPPKYNNLFPKKIPLKDSKPDRFDSDPWADMGRVRTTEPDALTAILAKYSLDGFLPLREEIIPLHGPRARSSRELITNDERSGSELDSVDFALRILREDRQLNPFTDNRVRDYRVRKTAIKAVTSPAFVAGEANTLSKGIYVDVAAYARQRFYGLVAPSVAAAIAASVGRNAASFLIQHYIVTPLDIRVETSHQVNKVNMCAAQVYETVRSAPVRDAYLGAVVPIVEANSSSLSKLERLYKIKF